VVCSLGTVVVGAMGIAVAPLLIATGQALGVAGVLVALLCGFLTSGANSEYETGVKLGLIMAAAGAVVYGAGYVVLILGTVSVAAGIGGGVYAGARMAIRSRAGHRMLVESMNEKEVLQEGS
jgi:hypothetical protein